MTANVSGRAAKSAITLLAALTVCVVWVLIGASAASANGVPLVKGDVLGGTGEGNITHYDPTGKILDKLETTSGSFEDTGMCFDAGANLYSTNFESNTMSKFDSGGNLLVASFGSGFGEHPESCVVDAANNIYVGQADGSAEVLKFNEKGELLASFAPEGAGRGTDWIDLASDQCTLHYTGEGSVIKAYNVCTKTQLADFATGLPGPCFAHRILPDGSELVACAAVVEHVSAAGEIIQTYTLLRENNEPPSLLFALNLDPDGTSFWTADLTTSGEIWRVDIASGKVLTQFSSAAPVDVAGLAIVGECTSAESNIKLSPATAENPVGTNHTVTATVNEGCGQPQQNVTVTFGVTGANPQTGTGTTNAAGEATFTYKGEAAGTDTIVASFEDKDKKTQTSNSVTKIWTTPAGEEPTTTSTSLSGGGQTGPSITVKEGTPVTDQATLTGKNAGSATGTVTYTVFSDNECTKEVASAGEVAVTGGSAPASNSETLAPGTYYWRAAYSGDKANAPSSSVCGAEVETVLVKPGECSKVVGSATVVILKEGVKERQTVNNKLSTNLASTQKLVFRWENGASQLVLTKLTSATCIVGTKSKRFNGEGQATINGEAGWHVKFFFIVTNKSGYTFRLHATKPGEEALTFLDKAKKLSSEVIS
jgi:hypothetical protein